MRDNVETSTNQSTVLHSASVKHCLARVILRVHFSQRGTRLSQPLYHMDVYVSIYQQQGNEDGPMNAAQKETTSEGFELDFKPCRYISAMLFTDARQRGAR